ncbi:ABC-F family ATP-binding cassette domain-containing protein [Corynebacterium nasicanis]|uniref:ABC-F family ATP-binding cassette domain-containing protein n=1 Tax=Corynebacterium nasicanis TaxID=1448267 RepID=A0ABW1QGE2_9CORY
MSHPITLSGVTVAWPDGSPVLDRSDAVFSTGRTGLIGDNGTGKTTILRLLAGELAPTTGTLTRTGDVAYLPQQLTLRSGMSVAGLLGIRSRLAALDAIEAGDPDPRHFSLIGDDWDIEARSRALLDATGLTTVGLDRPVETLSGGEAVLTALIGIQLADTSIALLDEPTNNLDRQSRARLRDLVAGWRGTLVVVSHDVELLELMDSTVELRDRRLTAYGGPYSLYREQLAREQAAAEQAVRTAEQTLKVEKRQRIEAETMLARRRSYAKTDYLNKRRPKIIMNLRKAEAQVSAGKLRDDLGKAVDAAECTLREQESRVRRESHIRIDLPDPEVPAGRRLLELVDAHGTAHIMQGPERLALTGRNGAGKTRLLETLFHDADTYPRLFAHTGRIGYLPQRLDHLDDGQEVVESIRAAAPAADPQQVRANLARFLFTGDDIHRRVGDLSGGERFRVALARLLLAEPTHQLLLLDEPTNNLDLNSIDEVVSALSNYHGGLVVISHDEAFLGRLEIDTRLELQEGLLTRS